MGKTAEKEVAAGAFNSATQDGREKNTFFSPFLLESLISGLSSDIKGTLSHSGFPFESVGDPMCRSAEWLISGDGSSLLPSPPGNLGLPICQQPRSRKRKQGGVEGAGLCLCLFFFF